MDREQFITLFNEAPATLDMERCHKIISECLDRCWDLAPQYPRGHMNLLSTAEECAELTEALVQRERGRVTDNYGILEEIGDVILSILCMGEYFGIPDEDMVKAVNAKMEREARRIAEHKKNKTEKSNVSAS